jgi:ABC-type sugar transport system ATPase subunit
VAFLGLTVPVAGDRLLAATAADVLVGIRPEDVVWSPHATGLRFDAEVDLVEPMGHEVYVRVRVADVELVTRFPPRSGVSPGDTVELALDAGRIHVFDPTTERSLLAPVAVQPRSATSSGLPA